MQNQKPLILTQGIEDKMAITVVASITSAVSLGASDQVNLGTFSVTLADPT